MTVILVLRSIISIEQSQARRVAAIAYVKAVIMLACCVFVKFLNLGEKSFCVFPINEVKSL